jgi:hypothetical protein
MPSPDYGKANLLQTNMLMLAGILPTGYGGDMSPDELRLELMRKAHQYLSRRTGVDFRYTLRGWHEWLQDSEFSDEYTFDYAWEFVKARVEAALDDPAYLALCQLAENRNSSQQRK